MVTAETGTGRPRPDLLAFPAPTTTRYLVLLVALVTAGCFVGNWVHNGLAGEEYVRVTYACTLAWPDQPGELPGWVGAEDQRRTCRAGVERVRAGYMLAGAAVVALGGAVLLWWQPRRTRRHRGLRPATGALEPAQRRVVELAAQTGVHPSPGVEVGRNTQRDAFSYGAPGRYVIALPPAIAVRWRQRAVFDLVVRHELAHVRHRDVALAWLARSAGLVLGPLLALPLIVGLVVGDWSLLPTYLWRAVLLGAVVLLASAALLRSREHDADLRAAQYPGGAAALAHLLTRIDAGRPPLPWFRRLLAAHPSSALRAAVLQRPDLAAPVGFVDGFVAAFLAATIVPLTVTVVIASATGTVSTLLAQLVGALLAGALLGGSVGLGLWRATAVARAAGVVIGPWPAALGVAIGLAAGEITSLSNAGLGLLGDTPAAWYPVMMLLAVGGTLVVHGIGELWVDVTPALARPWLVWLPAVLVGGLMYTLLGWLGQTLDLLLDAGGWPLVGLWLFAMPQRWIPAAVLLVLAGFVLVALAAGRPGEPTPRWLADRTAVLGWPVRGPGLRPVFGAAVVAGVFGAAVLVGHRLAAGPSSSDAGLLLRVGGYLLVAAAIGWVTALVVALYRPGTGPGVGVLVVPVVTSITVAGFLVLNTALGGGLNRLLLDTVVLGPMVLGFLLLLLTAPITAVHRVSIGLRGHYPSWSRRRVR